jgi:predicted kinase
MIRYEKSPALDRLEWILAGLDGTVGWGADAAEVLALPMVTPEQYVNITRHRSATYAPVTVQGLDVDDTVARARIRRHDGEIDVVTCKVEATEPYRIVSTWVQGLVPQGLTPRLPQDFTDHPACPAKARLVVFSGLPGSGKSTLAEAVGAELGIPVFATDWLLGALTPFGGRHFGDQFGIAEELLTTLAYRQLQAGQSAILDHPTEEVATRNRWRSLAGAGFRAVHVLCSDPDVHRARVEGRSRGIPGWHEGGDWANIRRRQDTFPDWRGEALVVDTIHPLDRTIATVLEHISRGGQP